MLTGTRHPRSRWRGSPAAPLEHPQEHRHFAVHVVVDSDLGFAGVEAVQATRVLHERALPGDGQGQEQGVEVRVVEALAM